MKNSTKKNFVRTNDRHAEEEEEIRFAFLKRERERSEREVIRVLKMRENSPRRKDTMDKI